MKFPQLVVDQKEYGKHLANLLEDPDCLLLFDTNILSQMFSLHQAARKEFADWIASRKAPKNRIALPAWCLHEYTNKVIRNQLREYIPVNSYIANTISYSTQLIRHLAMSTDDRVAKGRNHDDRSAFMLALEQSHEAFIKMLPKPPTDEKTVAAVHQDVIEMFGDSVAKSDIFSLLKTCEADYGMRYDNHLPPGFLDDHKDKNKLGDYIIWREMLGIARTTPFRNFLYVSNDGKRDWLYAPLRVKLPDGDDVENTVKKTGSIIRLIDPRLEYELSLAAEADIDIMLITFEQLVQILVRQDEMAFKQLAEAIQLSKASSLKETAPLTEETPISATPLAPTAQQPPIPPTPIVETIADLPAVTPTALAPSDMKYPNWVMADADYSTRNTPIGDLIKQFWIYTWDIQNAAVNALTVPIIDKASVDELFVLGRNVLQAAAGSSFAALEFIAEFPGRIAKASQAALMHLFNGMLYEVYFDSNNHFRYSKSKGGQLYELCEALGKHEFLRPCASFIAFHLDDYEHYVLFIPFLNQGAHKLTFSFQTNKNSLHQLPVLESCTIDDDPEPITVNIPPGMGTPSEDELIYLHYYARDTERLSAAVALSRYIPVEFVTTVFKVDDEVVESVDDYRVPSDLAV